MKRKKKCEKVINEEPVGPSPKKLRTKLSTYTAKSSISSDIDKEVMSDGKDIEFCIICKEPTGDLRKAHDKDGLGVEMIECAIKTKNKGLEYRLPINNDLVAADVFYHYSCWITLKNDVRSVDRKDSASTSPPFDAIAIAHIVVMITSSENEVFKLSTLTAMYRTILINSGQKCRKNEPHSSRFKDHILEHLPGWQWYTHGCNVMLSHDGTVRSVLADRLNDQVNNEEAIAAYEDCTPHS